MDAKLSIPFQMTKFPKFWVPWYLFCQYFLLIKIQPKGGTVNVTWKFSVAA